MSHHESCVLIPRQGREDHLGTPWHSRSDRTNRHTTPKRSRTRREAPRVCRSGRPDGCDARTFSACQAKSSITSPESPRNVAVPVPARQAYSHSASVGKR